MPTPKRSVPRPYAPVVGKCYYCGEPIRAPQLAKVADPAVILATTGRPIQRKAHSGRSGYTCEDELRTRFASRRETE